MTIFGTTPKYVLFIKIRLGWLSLNFSSLWTFFSIFYPNNFFCKIGLLNVMPKINAKSMKLLMQTKQNRILFNVMSKISCKYLHNLRYCKLSYPYLMWWKKMFSSKSITSGSSILPCKKNPLSKKDLLDIQWYTIPYQKKSIDFDNVSIMVVLVAFL